MKDDISDWGASNMGGLQSKKARKTISRTENANFDFRDGENHLKTQSLRSRSHSSSCSSCTSFSTGVSSSSSNCTSRGPAVIWPMVPPTTVQFGFLVISRLLDSNDDTWMIMIRVKLFELCYDSLLALKAAFYLTMGHYKSTEGQKHPIFAFLLSPTLQCHNSYSWFLL